MQKNLLCLNDLTAENVREIFRLADTDSLSLAGKHVAWSYEGNGIRTRTSFLRAFHELGCTTTELPNFLKTSESVLDLAGFMDRYYDIYVIRERNHERLDQFSRASEKPVISALSNYQHPCEALADFYWGLKQFPHVEKLKVALFGPNTNVLRSWYDFAELGLAEVCHCAPEGMWDNSAYVACSPNVSVMEGAHMVITDGWPEGFSDARWTLDMTHLARCHRDVKVIPTPPFTRGAEIADEVLLSPHFCGYAQKDVLLPVQKGILAFFLLK